MLQEYRLIVRKKLRKDCQIDAFTKEAFEYFAVVTNDKKSTKTEVLNFYNQRGAMEKQFDIMKNDFGWNHMPFSKISENTVFLFFMSICRNLYQRIIEQFSIRFKGLKPTYRMKKFIFRFITVPAKWINRSRQKVLIIYGKINFHV